MARYSREHKAATRERILATAAELFRKRGYDGVGVDALMEAAGLTRGAFYAHFDSKAALFAAVVGIFPELVAWLREVRGDAPAARPAQTKRALGAYLALDNRAAAGVRCSMATLTADAARGDRGTRRAYTEGVRALVAELTHHVQHKRGKAARQAAQVAAATIVGAMSMARAVDDQDLAETMLTSAREQVLAVLLAA